MKNLKLNTKKLLAIILVLSCTVTFSQNEYLKITQGDSSWIGYPPGTKFELKNDHDYTVLKDNKTLRTFKIDGDYTLTVFPTYKFEKDIYKLKKGSKVEIVSNKTYLQKIDKKNTHVTSHGVTGEKFITDSKAIENSKNILFKLSNGITFQYNDGKYNAYLNNEENYLNVQGRYFIESDLGILKISFNPKNGETWWVFEPKK